MSSALGELRRTRAQVIAFDLLLACAIGAVEVVLQVIAARQYAAVWATALLLVAIVVRRFNRLAMILLALAAGVLQMVHPPIALIADLGYGPVFAILGADRDRRVRLSSLIAAAIISISVGIWAGFVNPMGAQLTGPFELSRGVAIGACAAIVIGLGWTLGLLRHQRAVAVQALLTAAADEAEKRRLAAAFDEQQERARIATDMHDIVAHSWAVVAAQADGARYTLHSSPESAEQALEIIAETARSSISDLRALLARLNDRQIETPTPGHEQRAHLLERMRLSGMRLDAFEQGTPSESPLLALTAFRLLAESLTNALKYGDLTELVVVEQNWSDGYWLRVRNRVDPDACGIGTGHGLTGMHQRAELAGGRLITHLDGNEWIVEACIPGAGSMRGEA